MQQHSQADFSQAGEDPVPLFVEVSQIILQEADQPHLVVDLAYPNGLASEHGTEFYLGLPI
jgi:hypothetical protein